MGGWKYYNHAMMPDCKPHENANIEVLTKDIWKYKPWKKAFFAKYTSDWDCTEKTGWYWVIKDTPIDLQKLKGKHRYEIKKGLSNFTVKPINPVEYPDEVYDIAVDTLKTYPRSYQHIPDKKSFVDKLSTWKFTFGAFGKESHKLCGYIIMVERDEVLYYSEQRVLQNCEKLYINSALVYRMVDYYRERIENGAYIVDGEKNIVLIDLTQQVTISCNSPKYRTASMR